jgi:hypothetical protein
MFEFELRGLDFVASAKSPEELRTIMVNAKKRCADTVYHQAFWRLCEMLPSEKKGTVEYDVWKSVYALEEMLKEKRGKTVRLSRTRQKIQKDGERKAVEDIVKKPNPSENFHELIGFGHPELLFEAVVLRHLDAFPTDVNKIATNRLIEAGVDLKSIS